MWFFLVGNAANLMRRVDWSVVYRGELQDGRLVATKCLNQEAWPAEEELLTEIKISTCLLHANIVSLIGYCVEPTHLILVYNLLPQGNLNDHLHGTRTRHKNPSNLLEEFLKSLTSCSDSLSVCYNQTIDIDTF